MPTPSSSAPEPQSPRSFSFTSCPDPEELQTNMPSTSRTQLPSVLSPQSPESPQSPSSWHPRPPVAYETDVTMTNDAVAPQSPRSATMSPQPLPEERQAAGQFEGVIPVPDQPDESQKQAEQDAETNSADNEAGAAEGSNTGEGAVARPPNTTAGESSSRRRSKYERPSPIVGEVHELDGWGPVGQGPRWVEDSGLVGLGYEFSHMRSIPTTPSSFLRPGSKFEGSQESERQRYDVEVEIKHVDMRESFLCGYLKIQGLTDDHPTLTTYFEGEIIGPKYGFITQHPSWGATDKIDLSHWGKFSPFRPYAKQARKGGQILVKDMAQREHIFMRWKEHFLVPDHRVRTINGASFEGFYYICFNQIKGEVSGIYFHSKSEKFQRLELRHIPNKGCYGAVEFR
ncbi:vacuolar import and degradation protein-domain-containing protein [Triangularia verruculosa]|uniref:Vacuolar import and degradation protein-domain-containing protein n=1 Tax=Triangularia verruculosa TaxID=2587418 RepID=A0AAN6XGT4_9PEZI|nr:vacuolar import and degradation protein-domain-containing protein [Triangularia verruculosa]